MENVITEFEFSDIEDVRIIIKAKGKNFGLAVKTGHDREEAKQMRLVVLHILLNDHAVVNTALEDINRRDK